MRYIKTLGLAAVAALAIMGVMASSALASNGPSGTKVDLAEEVHITATSPALLLTVGEKKLTCHVILTATITTDGVVHIKEEGSIVTPGDAGCTLVELEEFGKTDPETGEQFWTGVVCGNGDETATLYLDTAFSTPIGSFTGWVEAPLVGLESAGFTGATVNTNVGSSSATLKGEFGFDNTVFGTETPGTSCA